MSHATTNGPLSYDSASVDSVTSWKHVSVVTLVGGLGVLLMAAINMADVRSEDASSKLGLDTQVVAKLGVVGMLAAFGACAWLTSWRVRKVTGTLPLAWLGAVIAIFLATSATALDIRAALVSSGSMVACWLAVTGLSVRLGPLRVAWLLLAGQILFVIGSWLCFLLWPSKGVFYEPIADGAFVKRMAGLAHPNTLGLFSGLTLVAGVCCWRLYRGIQPQSWRWVGLDGLMLLVLSLAGGALIFSLSRTAAAAVLITLVYVFRHHLLRGLGLKLFAIALVVGLSGLLLVTLSGDADRLTQSRINSLFSKSSDADELTSLTGRSLIWAYTSKLIAERPLTGYGATSSKELLRDYMSYAHNTLLHIGLSAGVLAMGAWALAVGWYLVVMIRRPVLIADAVFIFLIVNGLTENVGFEYIASAPMAWWVLVMAWRPAQGFADSAQEVFRQ